MICSCSDKGDKGVETEGKEAFQNYKKDEAGPQANHAQFGKDEMAAFKGVSLCMHCPAFSCRA